ncbi:ECF transporter S component [Helicovermis profundi]|uniref:ECF transporter S component n=1 Tax=Helicovermis profundi TaxID=3065157 RepID=A0AAU9E4X6_9FIRM|nr:ECF transporter S component [Clostridia bacterium S502]
MKFTTKKIVLAGVMAAMVTIGTMLIHVPTPTKGYIHIGDSLVYLAGILLGPVLGSLAAGLGSMISDLLLGYAVYAVPTFIIKALDAFVVGYLYLKLSKNKTSVTEKSFSYIISFVAGGAVMVLGYLAFETFLYGFIPATAGVVSNTIQAIGGGILGYPLLIALEKTDLRKYIE